VRRAGPPRRMAPRRSRLLVRRLPMGARQTPEFASRIRSEALPQPARWVQMEAQRWDRLDKTLFWAVLLGLAALTIVIVAALLMR
jgi:hypothetical protein